MQDQKKEEYSVAEQYINDRKDATFRWGTRMLRGGQWNYNPCVFDRTGWEDFYLALPVDYDIRNDPVFDLSRSTYKRLGDLGFSWPEPCTREAMRTGYCGPDRNSLTRPGRLRFIENDQRPEPAYRLHLTDRTALHHMRADPLEGVLPFGRQYDMSNARSVMHRDYKWRRKCCAVPSSSLKPCLASRTRQLMKTDFSRNDVVDRIIKCDDDFIGDDLVTSPLLKLKKAYNWPINTITGQPLGGRLLYYKPDPDTCARARNEVWPCGENKVITKGEPMVIPDQRCELLAHGPKKTGNSNNINWNYNASALDMRFPTPNWECWEEVPENCRRNIPSECCFKNVETKTPDNAGANVECPRRPCPPVFQK